jgi:GNAT superfamily N-acetyltransferase
MRGLQTGPGSLAPKMHRLQLWLDGSELPATARRHVVDASAAVIVDPTSNSPAASLNRNAIRLSGAPGLRADDLANMSSLFSAAGVERYFVWLSPGPASSEVLPWLKAQGAVKVPWTRYPTMIHSGVAVTASAAALQVREVTRRDIDAAGIGAGHAAIHDGYLQSLGRPGFQHFAAYSQDQLIAAAALAHFEDMAYLTYACTAESHRRRGAQSALIAARVAAANELGCRLITCQTLTMLEDSFANLKRAGFVEAYEKEVFECKVGPDHS